MESENLTPFSDRVIAAVDAKKQKKSKADENLTLIEVRFSARMPIGDFSKERVTIKEAEITVHDEYVDFLCAGKLTRVPRTICTLQYLVGK